MRIKLHINRKTFVLNTALVLMMALCVFSPIYQFQTMVFILGCFLLWGLATTQIGISWIRRANVSLLCLGGMLVLYAWHGLSTGNLSGSLNSFINQMPIYMWLIILEFYIDNKIMPRVGIRLFFLLFLITTYFTIVGNLLHPGASRLLASTLQYYTAQREQYRAAFIGGYDIIHGAVFLAMPLTLLARRYKWVWAIIISLFVMVAISSYTIAIILMLFMIICGIARVKNIWKLVALFCSLILIVSLFEEQIISGVSEFALSIDSEILSRRVTSLLTGEYFSELGDDNNRITIYFNEIRNWLDHPIFGNLLTSVKEYRRGGHSTLLAYLAQFGLLSGVFFAYLRRYYMTVKRALSAEYGKLFSVYFIFFVIFGLIDRYETFIAIGVCVFFMAPLLFMMADKEEHQRESALVDK